MARWSWCDDGGKGLQIGPALKHWFRRCLHCRNVYFVDGTGVLGVLEYELGRLKFGRRNVGSTTQNGIVE